jgi:hypothetical protein
MLAKGYYKAVIEHVWPRDGSYGPMWEWGFKVGTDTLKAFTSANLKNEKTQRYLNAVLGYIPDGEFFASDLAGLSCTVEVGTTVAKNGKTYNCIESVV